MSDSGGRRIMREYALKLDYIKPCTPESLEKMKAFDDELAQFITGKQQQAAEGRVANTDNPAGLVNGTIDTNVGLLRAYMALYLRRHPFINKDMDLMVRTLAPTGNGLPVQIYCFSSNKNWPTSPFLPRSWNISYPYYRCSNCMRSRPPMRVIRSSAV